MTSSEAAGAPRIETERLILRGHAGEDFEPLAAMWADPEMVEHIGGEPFPREVSWQRFLRYYGLWPILASAIGRSRTRLPAHSPARPASPISSAT